MPLRARAAGAVVAALLTVVGLTARIDAAGAAPPPGPYPCSTGDSTQFQPASGYGVDVSAIGWAGNHEGSVACLGGSFYVQNGIDTTYGYGAYDYRPTTWVNADRWLPALVTSFTDHGAQVSITNFGDRVVIGGNAYVLDYSRFSVHNPTGHPVTVAPEATAGMVPLATAPATVAPGATVDHDYVVAADRFGNSYAWPSASAMQAAGGWDQHFAHMRQFWDGQVSQLTHLSLPDPQLVDAYLADFAYTEIDRSGVALDTGTNGYHAEYEHDVIGILVNLFNEGDFSQAHALLDEVDRVVGTNGQYADGLWTYPWLWAIYLEKTGDLSFVQRHFASPGPLGPSEQPSIEQTAHQTAADRTGPNGIMEQTSDIDANGYWTSDDFEALLGMASYAYLAKAVGNASEASWATSQYDSLQHAVDTTLAHTASTYGIHYLPCSMVEPNSWNRCADPLDGNWAAPGVYTNAAWHTPLVGAAVAGIAGKSMATWLDQTLGYGFHRTAGVVPPTTFGGYPGEGFWSTAYNAGYGAWGLASHAYRDESIRAFEWMTAEDQAGPYAWWEGSAPPLDTTPWIGNHPSGAGGASPHSWGMSLAAQGLLDSLASQATDGTLIVGRGVPDAWLAPGRSIGVSHFPTTDGRRLGFSITSTGQAVTLSITSGTPAGPVVFDLPAFVDNIASSSSGTVNEGAGTVTVPASTRSVTVNLRHLTLSPAATSLRIDPAGAVHVGTSGTALVTATFADNGPGTVRDVRLALHAPAGWRVTPVAPDQQADVPAGTTLTGAWRVTAPAGSHSTRTAALDAVATWVDSTTRSVRSASAPELLPPGISSVSAGRASSGQVVTVTGSNFGATQGTASALTLTDHGTTWSAPGTLPTLTVLRWSNDRITFVVPTPSGASGDQYHVVPGTTATLQVTTPGGSSNTVDLAITRR